MLKQFSITHVTAQELMEEEYYFEEHFDVAVKVGQEIKVKQILARSNKDKQKITSRFAWEVKSISEWCIVIVDKENRSFEYSFDIWKTVIVKEGDSVKKGQKITDGSLNLQKLMDVAGVNTSLMKLKQFIHLKVKL